MSRSSPYVITLADADRGVLEERARSYPAPHGEVVRAKIVLLAALASTGVVYGVSAQLWPVRPG